MRTRGREGVQKSQNLADVLYVWSPTIVVYGGLKQLNIWRPREARRAQTQNGLQTRKVSQGREKPKKTLLAEIAPKNCLEAVKEWNKTLRGLFAMTITQVASWSPFMNEVPQTNLDLENPKSCLTTGPGNNACTWLRECCREVEAEVISSSRNQPLQTTYKYDFQAQ